MALLAERGLSVRRNTCGGRIVFLSLDSVAARCIRDLIAFLWKVTQPPPDALCHADADVSPAHAAAVASPESYLLIDLDLVIKVSTSKDWIFRPSSTVYGEC
jgi:hypothetical protein